MKIALCFSGIPRFWDRLDFSDYGEVYPFVHSWTDNNGSNCAEKLYPDSKGSNYKAGLEIIKYIKPIDWKFESLKYKKYYFNHLYSKFRNYEGKTRESVLPMYYSVKESIKLALNHNIKFDLIVRTRFDIKWIQPLKFIINNSINIPDQFHYMGLCDQFSYGTPELMEKYSEVFDYLERTPDIQLNPEIILKDYLHQQNLQVNFFEDEFILLR